MITRLERPISKRHAHRAQALYGNTLLLFAVGCTSPQTQVVHPSSTTSAPPLVGTCCIEVKFLGLDQNRGSGPVHVALWNSRESFMRDGEWLRGVSVPIARAAEGVLLSELPEGRYAISAFHDSKAVGALRQGPFGIPLDPWAISNAGSSIIPPAWSLASFELTATNKIIELDFLHGSKRTP